MTDERMGDGLWRALHRLPGDGGVVFRHYSLESAARAELAKRVSELCRSRELVVAIGGDVELADELGADLVHNPCGPTRRPLSRSVHTLEEARPARTGGAALVFVSPVFATRSHPDQPALGPQEACALARAAEVPAIALGGMDAQRFATLPAGAFHGWAAIDAWLSPAA